MLIGIGVQTAGMKPEEITAAIAAAAVTFEKRENEKARGVRLPPELLGKDGSPLVKIPDNLELLAGKYNPGVALVGMVAGVEKIHKL